MSDKIAWEPHPVSAARKQELRRQGFKIMDAKFKPAGTIAVPVAEPEVVVLPPVEVKDVVEISSPRRGRPRKVGAA